MGDPTDALASVERFIALSDVVKVSDEDLAWLTGDCDIDEVARRWLDLGPSIVIVTRGKHGCVAFTSGGLRVAKSAGDVDVVDTVGAGDSFMGGVIDALWGMGLRGATAREELKDIGEDRLRAILDRASAVSDVTVSRKGANPPWAHELP